MGWDGLENVLLLGGYIIMIISLNRIDTLLQSTQVDVQFMLIEIIDERTSSEVTVGGEANRVEKKISGANDY